jgi:hypothetical protein
VKWNSPTGIGEVLAVAEFQLEQLCPLLVHEESRSNTTLTGSPRTANTMNEVFGCLRKVMVNDVCDVLYVNAVRSHIHRD